MSSSFSAFEVISLAVILCSLAFGVAKIVLASVLRSKGIHFSNWGGSIMFIVTAIVGIFFHAKLRADPQWQNNETDEGLSSGSVIDADAIIARYLAQKDKDMST